MSLAGAAGTLSDKRRLAAFLEAVGASSWAPLTAMSPDDLRDGGAFDTEGSDAALWFLKHARVDNNKGVSVHLGRSACCAVWLALPEAEREDYVAQREVQYVLLDGLLRKLTLRVYVLFLVLPSYASALVRREFICRSHPLPYDKQDPDPARHVHSTLGKFGGAVTCTLCSNWAPRERIWPEVCAMLAACVGPFLPTLAASEVPGADGAKAASYLLLGADVLVDSDFRPWLVELNEMPSLAPVRGDDATTAARKAVIDDVLAVVLDPVLKTGCLHSIAHRDRREDPGRGAWEMLAEWNGDSSVE